MNLRDLHPGDPEPKPDITQVNIQDMLKSGKFTPEERKEEYRRRGKSPSGVIDGVYNDEYREDDKRNVGL